MSIEHNSSGSDIKLNEFNFFPAANWQKRLAEDHEKRGQLPHIYLEDGESIWLRLLPPEFVSGDKSLPFLPLVHHVWRESKAMCPNESHAALISGDAKSKIECPACAGKVPYKPADMVFGMSKGGTVVMTVSQPSLLQELIDADAFDLNKGRWVEFYRQGWQLRVRYGRPEPIDREVFEQSIEMAQLYVRQRTPNYGLLEQMAKAQAGWIKAGEPEPQTGRARQLRSILPHETLVAPIWGMKSPHDPGWQNTSYLMMDDPEYLTLLDKNNIGLLCGRDMEAVRCGARPDLITIGFDADDQEVADIVLDKNPQLNDTFTAWGARAPKWFFHVPGDRKKLLETCKIYQRRGDKHVEVGSWLSTGAQGVIDGLHPSGCFYRHNGKPIITLESLNLPRNIYLGTVLAQYAPKRRRGHWSNGAMLDLNKLENVHKTSEGHEARCPACADDKKDKAGDNLLVYSDGRFKCAAMIDSTEQENHRHNQKIWQLAGTKGIDNE